MNHHVLQSRPANPHPIDLGLGFNWFDHLGAGGHYARWASYPLHESIYPDLSDEHAWETLVQGLDELGLEWIRFGLPPNAHVDSQGRFIPETVHIKRLQRLDRWASAKGKTILVDPFLIPYHHEFPVPEGTVDPGQNIVNMAAQDNHAYARQFVAPLFDRLIHQLGMSSVRYFNPVNEPMEYGVYQTPPDAPPALVHYVDMYREIRAALDEIGIDRDRLGLVGIDGSFPTKILLEQLTHGVDIDPHIEAYAVHHYDLKLDYLPTRKFPEKPPGYFNSGIRGAVERDDAALLEYCRSRRKPLWALEMGTFYYGKFDTPEGVASLDACLTVSEAVIRAVNVGVTTFCIWSLMNPNTVDGHWAVIGLKDGELVRHRYPFAFYGLLGHHLPAGATVHPLVDLDPEAPEIAHVHATALEKRQIRTMLLVNDHPADPRSVTIQLPGHWPPDATFTRSLSDRDMLFERISDVRASEGELTLTLPPFSLVGLKATAP